MLDLERDVCASNNQGYFMVPQKVSFLESLHVCKKLTGTPISYVDKRDFNNIVSFLSLSSNMKAAGCVKTLDDGSTQAEVGAGGSDEAREGVWTTWDTEERIEVGSVVLSQMNNLKKLQCIVFTLG